MKKPQKMTRGEAVSSDCRADNGCRVYIRRECWNARITQDEAQYVTATFSSYKEDLHRGHVQQIILPFEIHEQPFIDGVC